MLYPSMFALAIVATTALIGIDQAGAQGPAGVVEQRIAAMKTNGAAMRTLVPLARGEAPWNQAAAIQALETLQRNGEQTVAMFPRGSDAASGVKTAALASIWEKASEFAAAAKVQTDAADALLKAARANDEQGFRSGFAAMGRSCGGCHEGFRAKQ
jgi:cytochrome c556